jgi:hypothetical protein
MAAEAALYQPIDPTDEIEDVARQIMRCMPEERIYGGLVLPPNVDSFPGPSGPASRCPPNRIKTRDRHPHRSQTPPPTRPDLDDR